MAKIIFPTEYPDIEKTVPVVFVAGPIKGGNGWQERACQLLNRPDLVVACPRRTEEATDRLGPVSRQDQAFWEFRFLDWASLRGVVMFWLPREDPHEHDCARAYAQTSRAELGWHLMRSRHEGVRLVLGIEPGFSNGWYLELLRNEKFPDVPLCHSLEETCAAALALLPSTPLP